MGTYGWRGNHKQAAPEGGCCKDLAEHLKGGKTALGDAHGFRPSRFLEKLDL